MCAPAAPEYNQNESDVEKRYIYQTGNIEKIMDLPNVHGRNGKSDLSHTEVRL